MSWQERTKQMLWNHYSRLIDVKTIAHAYQDMIERTWAFLIPIDGQVGLDAGCGAGNFLLNLQYYSSWFTVIGIDFSESMISQAKMRFNDDPRFSFLQADLNKQLIFTDESFDFVISCSVLFNLNDPAQVIKEFYRVLKLGGKIVIMTPRYNTVPASIFVDHFKWLFKSGKKADYQETLLALPKAILILLYNVFLYAQSEATNDKFFEPDEIEKIFESAGFTGIKVESAYCGIHNFVTAKKGGK